MDVYTYRRRSPGWSLKRPMGHGLLVTALVGLSACGNQEPTPATPHNAESDASAPTTSSVITTQAAVESAQALVNRDPPNNAAPLGLEIGYANVEGVKTTIGSTAALQKNGTNQFSGGPMLVSDGAGLGVDGLSHLNLIFDKSNVLVGMVMTLPKAPGDMLKKLSTKYSVVNNRIDSFMDYGYARLAKGDSLVEIDAPHLSFTMEVRYLTKQLMADFQAQSAEAKAASEKQQTDKL
jgi:hypothetical protein